MAAQITKISQSEALGRGLKRYVSYLVQGLHIHVYVFALMNTQTDDEEQWRIYWIVKKV